MNKWKVVRLVDDIGEHFYVAKEPMRMNEAAAMVLADELNREEFRRKVRAMLDGLHEDELKDIAGEVMKYSREAFMSRQKP